MDIVDSLSDANAFSVSPRQFVYIIMLMLILIFCVVNKSEAESDVQIHDENDIYFTFKCCFFRMSYNKEKWSHYRFFTSPYVQRP